MKTNEVRLDHKRRNFLVFMIFALLVGWALLRLFDQTIQEQQAAPTPIETFNTR
jgi:hypothetical protein